MNWYKIAKTEHIMSTFKELQDLLKENGFFLQRNTGHEQYCHIRHPEYCVPIPHRKTKEMTLSLVKNIRKQMDSALRKIKEKEGKPVEYEVVPSWKQQNWYQNLRQKELV